MNFRMSTIDPFGALITPGVTDQSLLSLDIDQVRNILFEQKLVVLRGFQPLNGPQSLISFCEKWGQISVWPFGKILELIEQSHPQDHIFDHNYVPLHWDGMYRKQVPELQIFQCVSAPLKEQGGRTTFSHTALALKYADSSSLKLWKKVTGYYERQMEFYHSKTKAPVIDQHAFKKFDVIRYNEPHKTEGKEFLNPPQLEFVGIDLNELEEFHRSLQESLYSPKNFYAHEWQAGDIVIADNFTLLHGREAFKSQAPRHLRRVHVLSAQPLQNPHLVSYQ